MSTKTYGTVDEREVRERLSRCVSTMVFYRADGRSRSSLRLLRDEVGSLAAWASRSELGEDLDAEVLGPLEGELVVRYGDKDGRKLHREFLKAFRLASEGRPSA